MENEALKNQDLQEEALFGVSKELVEKIQEALEKKDFSLIKTLTKDLHTADMADLIQELRGESRTLFIHTLKNSINPEILAELEEPVRKEVFDILGTKGIAAAVADLNTDDALDVIEDLDEDQQQEVLRAIPAGERAILEEVLTYPEDSAGRLMQREIVCVPPFWTVDETLSFIRKMEDMDTTYYDIYVVDPRHHPIGRIALSKLLRHSLKTPVSKIMDTDLRLIPVDEDQEEVALIFDHYALVSAPVVDASGRIVGMITVDDVVSVIGEEAEEDILHMAKVSSESDFYAPVITTSYWRIRWLIITLVNTLMASFVIAQFQASIEKLTALSFLMTINAAMGGNSGMQVVTIVVRALATRSLREGDVWRAVAKEMSVSLITGGFFSVLLGTIAGFWVHDFYMGAILAIALICNMIWAAFAGTLLPIVIERLGMDPAISAGPILTTTTDVLGYAIFLGLATYFLV